MHFEDMFNDFFAPKATKPKLADWFKLYAEACRAARTGDEVAYKNAMSKL